MNFNAKTLNVWKQVLRSCLHLYKDPNSDGNITVAQALMTALVIRREDLEEGNAQYVDAVGVLCAEAGFDLDKALMADSPDTLFVCAATIESVVGLDKIALAFVPPSKMH